MGTSGQLTIREATSADAAICGQICYEAFAKINTAHGYTPDFPSVEAATGLMRMLFAHPGFYNLVAESAGVVVGSNCLDLRNPIAGIGPITVDPSAQDSGVGRQLMEAVLHRARAFEGVRLVQGAFHARSLSLYAKLGFEVREPLVVMRGPAIGLHDTGVREAAPADLPACNAVCTQVHGYDRSGELADAIGQKSARLVERNGRVTAYATLTGFSGHAVAESLEDLQAIIGTAAAFAGAGILVPIRNTPLFNWCLQQGLRVVLPLNLMTSGRYYEPRGPYLPSILY